MNVRPAWFVKASVAYLVVTSLAGVYLGIDASHPVQYRTAHSHLLLIGWVTLGLAGVLMSRGEPPSWLVTSGFWLTNVGLVGMTGAWMADALQMASWTRWAFIGAGTLELFGLFLVAVAIWAAWTASDGVSGAGGG
jgi:hypothetical membrane protein